MDKQNNKFYSAYTLKNYLQNLTTDTQAANQLVSVLTRATFAANSAQVFKVLMFYEEIGQTPPLLLRLLLPVPIRTEGRISEVGDNVMCSDREGDLQKRITRIEPGDLYEFEVSSQALFFKGDIRLTGGGFRLRELPDGKTEVSVETRYYNTRAPRWIWKPLEGMVCHSFHRYLLGTMRKKIKSSQE